MKTHLYGVDLISLNRLASLFSQHLNLGDVVLLSGPLGVGKTTFVQFLAQCMGIQQSIVSPTFTIVKHYPLPKGGELIHMDAYRLEGEKDDQQWMEYCHPSTICLIEWPEYLPSFSRLKVTQITFKHHTEQTRTLDIATDNGILAHALKTL